MAKVKGSRGQRCRNPVAVGPFQDAGPQAGRGVEQSRVDRRPHRNKGEENSGSRWLYHPRFRVGRVHPRGGDPPEEFCGPTRCASWAEAQLRPARPKTEPSDRGTCRNGFFAVMNLHHLPLDGPGRKPRPPGLDLLRSALSTWPFGSVPVASRAEVNLTTCPRVWRRGLRGMNPWEKLGRESAAIPGAGSRPYWVCDRASGLLARHAPPQSEHTLAHGRRGAAAGRRDGINCAASLPAPERPNPGCFAWAPAGRWRGWCGDRATRRFQNVRP